MQTRDLGQPYFRLIYDRDNQRVVFATVKQLKPKNISTWIVNLKWVHVSKLNRRSNVLAQTDNRQMNSFEDQLLAMIQVQFEILNFFDLKWSSSLECHY